jgi:hypothetical protein
VLPTSVGTRPGRRGPRAIRKDSECPTDDSTQSARRSHSRNPPVRRQKLLGFSVRARSGHLEKSALKKQHPKACKIANVEAFPLYTFRHTCLTRWAGHMDPYTLAYLAGHSDFSTTKRYVHPQPQTVLEAIERSRGAQGGHKTGHTRETGQSAPSCVIGSRFLKTRRIIGRGERIRTSGLLDPNQAL